MSAHLSAIAIRAVGAASAAGGELRLGEGSEVVARVVALPGAGGRGLISLAGALLAAQLPAGVRAGETLRLRVERADAAEVVLRLLGDEGVRTGEGAAERRFVASLAVSGDGALLRAALELTGGAALPLPGHAGAEVAVDPDGGVPDGESRTAHTARFVLHSPALGPIEVSLRLDAGGVHASVTTDAGAGAAAVDESLPDLVDALRDAAGRPAAATATVRPAGARGPRPPAELGGFSALA